MNDSNPQSGYTLEVLAEITGISTQTILHYQEQGIFTHQGPRFDDEAVRILSRIEHLRESCDLNLNGLKLLAVLLDEVENLRDELRALK